MSSYASGFLAKALARATTAHLEIRSHPWLQSQCTEPRDGDVVRRYTGADGSDGLSSIRS